MELINAEVIHSSTCTEFAEWVNAINRGGLCLFSDNTFLFFCSIEEALRAFLTVSKVKELSHGIKSTVVKSMYCIVLYWFIVAVEADEKEEILLKKIVELCITIREFFFA